MQQLQWGSKEQLKSLLIELVNWESLTGTEGEKQFAQKLSDKLFTLDYFTKHPEHLQLLEATKERFSVFALFKTNVTTKTIILMSHYDTVHIEEYGAYKHLATRPEELTEMFEQIKDTFTKEVKQDITSNEYLFGRGVMDMKMGLALHMQLLEKAIVETWPINIILLTVPDEEVNSAGMCTAIPTLNRLKEKHELDIAYFLNSEPSFSQYPNDPNYYIYSGSIGKIMPSALFYGRETHAGEPLNGMTSQFIASFLTRKMEWNNAFTETSFNEKTPLPVTLSQIDLKDDYSTQTSSRTAALYNVFIMKRTAHEVMEIFKQIAEEAAGECNESYQKIITREQAVSIGKVSVIKYAELITYAKNKLTEKKMNQLIEKIQQRTDYDEREKSIRIVDALMLECQELAPAMVLFFAPPYYPAINTSNDLFIKENVQFIQEQALKQFDLTVEQVHYFNGISDLSYVNYDEADESWKDYVQNTPTWGEVYHIPFTDMQQLQAPVLNVGPFGKDAHKVTERLHERNAFVETPWLLEQLMRRML